MWVEKLHELPVPSTSLEGGGVRFSGHGDFTMEYEYYGDDGQLRKGAIRIGDYKAFRNRVEICSTEEHIDDCYDTLVEVHDSSWLEEIVSDISEGWKDEWELHHYKIYFDGSGCYEFIACSWEAVPEEKGGQSSR